MLEISAPCRAGRWRPLAVMSVHACKVHPPCTFSPGLTLSRSDGATHRIRRHDGLEPQAETVTATRSSDVPPPSSGGLSHSRRGEGLYYLTVIVTISRFQ